MSIPPPDAALHLAAIVESSEDAILSKDLSGIITSWNRGAERLFGYASAEAVGRHVTFVIPDDRHGEEEQVLERIRRGERVEHFDTVRCRRDGSLVDISLTVSPIRDRDGSIIGASSIARDVSDRKRVEQDLRESQQRLMALAAASASVVGSPNVDAVLSASIDIARDVFQSDGYALWRVDPHGVWRVVRSFGVSEAFASRSIAVGPEHPASRSTPFSEPLIFEDVTSAPMLAGMREAYEGEGIRSMVVFSLLIGDQRIGTMVFYSKRSRRFGELEVKVGSAVASLASAALTTAELYEEQQRAREAADHARDQAAFLAEAGTALSASLDYQSTLKTVAQLAVPRIADWCAVDILDDRGVLRRLAVAHVDPAKVEFARALQEQYPADPRTPGGVYDVIRSGKAAMLSRIPTALIESAARDGQHLRILRELNLTSYISVPMMAHGKGFGAISFVTAESGREYGESDLRIAHELAARASLAVENARSYARASEANRLKDEFLATLSHELRTPLNAILGYARMLRLGTMSPDHASRSLEVIERNAAALQQIIEDVLDVSRIVTGRLRLNVQSVDLPAVLREACATVLPAAEAKGVRVETIVDPATSPVSGDPSRLQQVLWNLLSNAIKFTPRGGRVQVRLARVNSHVEIAVSDTGRGIAAEFLPLVFDRFRQADATFSRDHGGLGLGLSIAKQLVEMHGGSIAASSGGVGQGATFTVCLPLLIVHPAMAEPLRREEPRTEREPALVGEMPRLDGLRALAVDDDADSLHLLRTVLESAGARVSLASSAAEALEAIRDDPPDVMVADIGMAGMDGLQLIKAVRQLDEPARSVPAAALTAYARAQDRITSLASGFQMHLVKPVDPLELVVAVATIAARRIGA